MHASPARMRPSASFVLCLAAACSGEALKVTVLGGTGFVGSRVCKVLVSKGAEVTSVSRSGRCPVWASDEPWTKEVKWLTADLLGADAAVGVIAGDCDSVVSCVGVVDLDPQVLRRGNGAANVNAFASAKRAGVGRSVYVSVASEVAACEENWLPFAKEEFSAYFDGKRSAEEAAADAVGGDATKFCVIKPTFIYGGEAFVLKPPRVTSAYGSGVEEVLSLGPIQARVPHPNPNPNLPLPLILTLTLPLPLPLPLPLTLTPSRPSPMRRRG